MLPALALLAARQGGLVARRQCYAVGMTDEDLRAMLRPGGPWAVVRRGAYLPRERWEAVTDPWERVLLRDRAADLVMETAHVMSHDSAARALAVPMLRPRAPLVHVTRPGVGGSRTKAGVKHHLTRIELAGLRDVDGLVVTGPARTALDLAREHGLAAGVVALDHVLASGTARREVEAELAVMWSWPQVRTAREALALADPGAESPAESLARLFVGSLGVGPVETQFPVECRGTVFWADLRVGCHVIEVEGVAKLVPVGDGGLATRSTRELLRAREERGRLIRAAGLGLSYVGWDDLFGRAREHTRDWLTRDIRLTEQRHGSELPTHLAERAAYLRRHHPRRRS
ncbi:hypothetical protein SAMN04488570_3196 [Nocardioides scoriae]|uniref:Transcriptional regulator, AbiEi antitoxin, Type IV TA system n=1 Tax=Nocardioides scoriae TaxID=642780 RepID=A0A1H1WLH3_9ACTN|nr:hypothetical protein [Nocardioides scoriae]SDS97915.1 hypothetical protein SAMN04488570_3196 [Nocardioides scoriae]